MARFRYVLVATSLAAVIGCGSSAPEDEGAAAATAASAAASGTVPSPTDVVSQFLDEVRRGGQDSLAPKLLTTRAQSELARIGHAVQPIGSPNARFEVTRSEDVPGEPNAALVHSLWSEPREDGTMQDYQVVWAVERESAGWRISGLAIEIEADRPLQIIDFENGREMAQLLSGEERAAEPNPEHAQLPASAAAGSALSR